MANQAPGLARIASDTAPQPKPRQVIKADAQAYDVNATHRVPGETYKNRKFKKMKTSDATLSGPGGDGGGD